jgi:hypothetical protein
MKFAYAYCWPSIMGYLLEFYTYLHYDATLATKNLGRKSSMLAMLSYQCSEFGLELETAILWKGINWLAALLLLLSVRAHTSSYHRDDKSLFIYKQSVQTKNVSFGRGRLFLFQSRLGGDGMGRIWGFASAFVS